MSLEIQRNIITLAPGWLHNHFYWTNSISGSELWDTDFFRHRCSFFCLIDFWYEVIIAVAQWQLSRGHVVLTSLWASLLLFRHPEGRMSPQGPTDMEWKAPDWFIMLVCLSSSALIFLIFDTLLCKFVSYDAKSESEKERLMKYNKKMADLHFSLGGPWQVSYFSTFPKLSQGSEASHSKWCPPSCEVARMRFRQ